MLVLLLFSAGWIGFRYLEMKLSACECKDPIHGKRFALWNPIRDRTPERAAIEVLRMLRAGGCNTVPAAAVYCPEEARFKIVSWALTGSAVDGKDVIV